MCEIKSFLLLKIEGNKDSDKGQKRKRSNTGCSQEEGTHDSSWESVTDEDTDEQDEDEQDEEEDDGEECSEEEEEEEEEDHIDEADLNTPAEWHFLPLEEGIAAKGIGNIQEFCDSLTMFPCSKIV